MDHNRADSGFSGRHIGRSYKTSCSREIKALVFEARKKEDVMLRTTRRSFGVIASIHGLPEKTNELRRYLYDLACLTRHQKGCISCEMIENGCDSTEFTLLEEWSDRKAHDAHFKTPIITIAMHSIQNMLSNEIGRRRPILRLNSIRYGTNTYCLTAD